MFKFIVLSALTLSSASAKEIVISEIPASKVKGFNEIHHTLRINTTTSEVHAFGQFVAKEENCELKEGRKSCTIERHYHEALGGKIEGMKLAGEELIFQTAGDKITCGKTKKTEGQDKITVELTGSCETAIAESKVGGEKVYQLVLKI